MLIATIGLAGPAPASTPKGGVLWKADMENRELSDWYAPQPIRSSWHGGGEFSGNGARTGVSTGLAHTGRRSMKLSLPDGAGAARFFRWRELRAHRDTTQSVWLYFPRNYSVHRTAAGPAWWNIMQWTSRDVTNVVRPIWHLDVQNTPTGKMRIDLVWWHRGLEGPGRGQSGYRRFTQSVADVPTGRWFKLTSRLRQSKDFDGSLTVWQDGKQLFEQDNVRTSFRNCRYNKWCGSNEWSLTNYSDGVAPGPAVIYADDAKIIRSD